MVENDISQSIWELKYQNGSETLDGFYQRQADALDVDGLMPLLQNQAVAFGGRIMYALGTGKKNATLSNCFVLPIKKDSMDAIMDCAKESAKTMKAGGGVGYNFSILRPKNAKIKTSGESSSGVVSFMRIFDTTCSTIQGGGNRRGAQMGVLDIWHPDVLDFIEAKRDGSLSNFNISVMVTDEFMDMVEKDGVWTFIFPDTDDEHYDEEWDGNVEKWMNAGYGYHAHGTISAKELYDKIIKSNYEYAEPGVLFSDTINNKNTLHRQEFINTTNPCAEQPLSFYASCNLGSINLTKFVRGAFTEYAYFDEVGFEEAVSVMVKSLDKVLDVNHYPLEEQKVESDSKRQIGVGFTGFGDATAMMGFRYGDKKSVEFANTIGKSMLNSAVITSAYMARDKGVYPLYDEHEVTSSDMFSKLDPHTQGCVEQYGLRNSRLLSVAPTGTMSLFLGNVSSGIEPIFALEYERKVKMPDDSEEVRLVEDYAWSLFKEQGGELKIPDYFTTAQNLSVEDHMAIQIAIQYWIDTSISKTINVPKDYDYEDFSQIYMKAWKDGLKGCTTYRPNNILGSVLSVKGEKTTEAESASNSGELMELQLDDVEQAHRHRVVWQNGSKVYVNVSVNEDNHPLEIFAKLPKKASVVDGAYSPNLRTDMESNWELVCRLMSRLLLLGYPLEKIIDDCDKSAFSMHSLPALIKRVLEKYDIASDEEVEKIVEEGGGNLCPECGEYAVIKYGGCDKCTKCDYLGSCG